MTCGDPQHNTPVLPERRVPRNPRPSKHLRRPSSAPPGRAVGRSQWLIKCPGREAQHHGELDLSGNVQACRFSTEPKIGALIITCTILGVSYCNCSFKAPILDVCSGNSSGAPGAGPGAEVGKMDLWSTTSAITIGAANDTIHIIRNPQNIVKAPTVHVCLECGCSMARLRARGVV